MNNLVSGWALISLGELVKLENGDRGVNYPSQNDFTNTGVPFINAGDLKNGKVSRDKITYITRDKFSSLNSGKFSKGDILYCLRGSLGKFGLVDDLSEGAIASSLVIIRANKGIDNSYLKFYLESEQAKKMLDQFNNGSAQPNLASGDLRKFQVNLPNFEEQKKIAEILSSVDKVIELTEIEIEKLKNLKKGMMHDLLTKGIGHTKFKDSPIGKIPESWEVTTFEDACDLITDYTAAGSFASLKENVTYYYERNFARLIRLTDLRTDLKNPEGVFVDESGYNFLKRSNLKESDIMIANVGEYTGFTCLMPKFDMPATIAPNMFLVRAKSNFHALFMCSYMNLQQFQSEVDKISASSATKLLNKTNFRKMLLPVAPIDEQNKIAKIIDSLNKTLTSKNEKLERVKNIKKGLMQDLLTGKVRVKA